jgi:DNA repair photolyase
VRRIPLENPQNRFEAGHTEYLDGETPTAPLRLYLDQSKTALVENDSPDVGFRWSINPYRGCVHGCAYCYARPSHEYLGFGAGSDFERNILVKKRAPELLRRELRSARWRGELVVLSGNTDAYQPIEAGFRLTRACLEVLAEHGNPIHIITKGTLVERDIDVLADLSRHARVGVSVSIPFWDADVARAIEPYVATPQRRIETIRRLSTAGIRVTVNVAPLIPGLGDRDMPRVLEEARAAGARRAATIMLRLPGPVREVFESRLEAAMPLAKERVLARTREVRGGKLNDPRFHARMSGSGPYADSIRALFDATCRRLGYDVSPPEVEEPERHAGAQLSLFDRAGAT